MNPVPQCNKTGRYLVLAVTVQGNRDPAPGAYAGAPAAKNDPGQIKKTKYPQRRRSSSTTTNTAIFGGRKTARIQRLAVSTDLQPQAKAMCITAQTKPAPKTLRQTHGKFSARHPPVAAFRKRKRAKERQGLFLKASSSLSPRAFAWV